MAQIFKPPAIQRMYDACVIGSQLGGAVAGALLARRGYRVLHVGHDGPAPSYTEGGYLLPTAPALLPSPRHLPAAEMALRELGLMTDLTRTLEPCAPDLQILLPRHRVDVGHDPHVRVPELRREWPADAERLEAGFLEAGMLFDAASPFLKALPPLPAEGFIERRALSKALKFALSAPSGARIPIEEAQPFTGMEDHPLVASLRIARRFLGYLDGAPAALETTRLLGGVLRGSHRVWGAHEGLYESVRRKIAESRGELLGDGGAAVAERLEFEGRKVAAVRLAGSPNAWVARVFIAATDGASILRLLPPGHDTKLEGGLEAVRATRQLVTLNLVVKKSALPPALGDSVLALRDPAGSDDVDNAVLFQVLPARRERGKGPAEVVADERVLCAAGFVPGESWERGGEALVEVGKRIRAAVEDAVPFFDRHLVRESMPAVHGPRTAAPHPLLEVALERTLGVTALPCHSPVKNLVFASREVVPGLGLEGEFHAGVQAAAAAQELLGKRELLR